MLEAANRVVIARPTRDVFTLLANSENDPQWRRGVVEIKRISGEGRGGSTSSRWGELRQRGPHRFDHP